ncbi:uncharacterized protein LOC116379022 [Anarrhichthys ocellatus]|uniref:uncharacterized protein LOC116379022 n=1 Tax=Anarrhichthys ocellatus TaxID=433405 RepID=UPI0012EDB53B|nr:uncharacterized protein LOC116379022 [Anarrhichthys ocellatus]
MEQVLDFAVHELTKIVEASFDDLLLEITKIEREQQDLGETLDRGGGGGGGGGRGSENDSVSPSGSEDMREEMTEVTRETPRRDDPDRPPVLSVSQDWVPILDKVFGQKWCSDVWQIKELDGGGGGRSLNEGGADQVAPPSTPSVTLEPSPSSPQQDPRWTPLEDMEVFSPDEEAADAQRKTSRPGSGSGPGPPLSPTGSSGRRSSASMLHRLLTLPSQLLEEEDATKETMSVLSGDGTGELPDRVGPSPTRGEEEEEEEEGEEEDTGRKVKKETCHIK